MNEIDRLLREEQIARGGAFIQGVTVDEYLNKIKKHAEILVHFIEGQCAGFAAFYCNDPLKEQAFITLVLVAPHFRGRNVAIALLEGVICLARARGFANCQLEVDADNEAALQLYAKLGFKVMLKRAARSRLIKIL
ncbi:MAG: GNAT family N-acetyltransferase [Pseudomonas sp.]|uniref:GNAT family N-acetyltransferase n=1 Tax=Pseudomonas TaxID=286 RepID=UPI0003C06A7C|nr:MULTISPECIES: GNAT family N-acetyltransferase [unclassified Pseudomonas]AGZ34124.1 GCN5-like N-acetyltransferase [Pseudomonas sp. VLB120]WEZ89951.1 GNAT family N-acetyltransferase [Pseudomonas sp. NyZ480]